MGELVDLRAENAALYCKSRPCPWRQCRHHMATASIPPSGPMPSPARVRLSVLQPHTCALDIAATGPKTFGEVGRAMAMEESNVRRTYLRALRNVAKRLGVSVEEAELRLKLLAVMAHAA